MRPQVTGNNKVGLVDPPDELIPDPAVWKEFSITSMTGWRWTHDAELDFPPPIKICNRCYRSRRALEAFKQRMTRQAIEQRAARRDDSR